MSGSVHSKRKVQEEFGRCKKLLDKTNKLIKKSPHNTPAMQMAYELRGALTALDWVRDDRMELPSQRIPSLHE